MPNTTTDILIFSFPVYFNNIDDATKAVENGEAWGVISVGGNFSENLYEVSVDHEQDIDLYVIFQ